MALRRTVVAMARHDVDPARKLWWKKHFHVDGEVTQHLSPYEQKIVEPLIKEMPANFVKRVKQFLYDAGPAILIFGSVYFWAEWKHKQLEYHHRS